MDGVEGKSVPYFWTISTRQTDDQVGRQHKSLNKKTMMAVQEPDS